MIFKPLKRKVTIDWKDGAKLKLDIKYMQDIVGKYSDLNPRQITIKQVEESIVGWDGIVDQNNKPIPFSETMRKDIFTLLLMLLLVGCTEKGDVITMDMKTLSEDLTSVVVNSTFYHSEHFKTLDEGDTLIIKDTISKKRTQEENITLLQFSSMPEGGFYFEGNLTDYRVNDTVEIILHIERDIFKKATKNNTIWSFDIEIFKEGWDFDSHNPLPLPVDVLRQI